jgi:hypothetical protein
VLFENITKIAFNHSPDGQQDTLSSIQRVSIAFFKLQRPEGLIRNLENFQNFYGQPPSLVVRSEGG